MFRNVGRRLSRAVRPNEGDEERLEEEEGTRSRRRGSNRPDRGIGVDTGADGGGEGVDVEGDSASSLASTSMPRPEPAPQPEHEHEREPDAARARARSRSRSRSRRRTSTASRHPPPPDLSSSGAGGKRVQWAPKNRIEHFEHVPLEEEESDEGEESRYVNERMRELDEYGADPAVLARLHRALEPYALPTGRERSRSTRESELQLPAYISQSKPAPRSKNIKKLLNYPRRSSTVSGRPPSHTKTAVELPPPPHPQPHADPSSSSARRSSTTSAPKDAQDKEKRAHEVEREAVSGSKDDDPDHQKRSQELRNQPVQRYYDLGHSQLSSVPDIEPEKPLPVSSRVHDWTQKTEGVQDWAKKAQGEAQNRDDGSGAGFDPESVVEDTALEERGEQEKKWWENRARGLVQAYSARQRGPVRRTSFARSGDGGEGGGGGDQQRQRQRRPSKAEAKEETGAGETGRPRRGSRAAAADVDLEAGQAGPVNEPLPLGRQHGVLGTLLTLYRNPDLSRTMSDLESTGDETTTSDIQSLGEEEGDRGAIGRRPRRGSQRADRIEEGEGTTRARRRSSVRGRRPTGLIPPPAQISPSSPEEEEESSSSSSPEEVRPAEKEEKEKEIQPSKKPVRDRRQTGLPPFYIPSSPESTPPSPSPSSPETRTASPEPERAPAPVPRKGSVRGRRQTGLPPLQFPVEQPSPEREPSPSITEGGEGEEEEEEPQRKGKKAFRSPYTRLKKSLSAPGSVIHLPLPAYIPQPVTSTVPSRSSGGVVAALIATSNALAGPAAPRANTIAPDLTKRGYTLSRYRFTGGQQPSDAQTATSEDLRDRDRYEQGVGERPEAERGDEGLYRPRRGTSETGTTDTTLASSAEMGAAPMGEEGEESPGPGKLTKKPSFAWLPGLLSRSGSRGSSIFGDREKEREKGASTDDYTSSQTSLSGLDQEALARRIERRLNKRRRKEKRKMAQIYITKHIAEVLQRQEFMMKFARAHLMFAGPSHRLQGQLQATARVLDLQVSSVHFPNTILISFGDESTSTSMVKIIQQTSTLNLEKLSVMHEMFWKVIHDELSVSSASATLDLLMNSPSRYNNWQMVLTGGFSSAAICTISFSGSFADALVVFPLGCLLVIVQLISAKHELYSNVFEITIATVLSFLSAALASSSKFCYAAVASSSVVLILPGFFVLSGSLELASKQIVSGAVRICFAVIYALFLGFGLSIGAEVFTRITHRDVVGPDDFLCNTAHMPTDPWWQRKPSLWWAFLTVPLYSFALTLRNHAPLLRRETVVTILISCAGWTANHFAGVAFHNRPDLQSAIGAFAVGVIANLYARIFYGNAYVVMITGILFQLPSGLANGGLLTFAKNDNKSNNGGFTSFQSGFQVALQLISVAIGLTVGLFTSVVVVHPLGGSRKGANAVFSL